MNIDKEMNELFDLLDMNDDINKVVELKEKIGKQEILLINNYRHNPTIDNKLKLYDNKLIDEYLKRESNINYLIMEINRRFKRSRKCQK